MLILLDVPDRKAKLVKGLLKTIHEAKIVPLTKSKALQIGRLLEAIAAVNEIKQGRRNAVPLQQVLDEF